MNMHKSTLRSLREEKIAKGAIYSLTAITLIILALIVGYVLFKGFVTIRDTSYDVTSLAHTTLVDPSFPDTPLYLIAHEDIRIKEMTMEDLIEMYTRRRQSNWGDLTGQNSKIWPFMYALGSPYYIPASRIVTETGNEKLGDYVSYIETPEEMLGYIANVEGAVGLIPADMYTAKELKGVTIIPVRRSSLAVNPEVTSLIGNQQLRDIPSDAVEKIFTGSVTNWKELGGPDLPIVPSALDDKGIYTGLHPYGLADIGRIFTDKEEYVQAIETTPGAVGLVLYKDIKTYDLQVLDIIRHEVSQNLTWHYIIESPARSGAWGGISTIIINTFVLILFTLLFSSPIGIMAAIYLIEYATEGRLIKILRLGTETLAGIPSIVFGLFGYIFFVDILNLGIGFISATLTITLMILPTIVRTSEEALKSVPNSYREGSLALGATKLTTIYKVVLPAASPGILSGVILAVGRVIGETAVLIYTLGSNYELVRGPTSSARVLSLHIYNLFSEAISFERSFATATVLIFMILLVNFGTNKLITRLHTQQRS